jgi:oxygen-independent coproporphyrinogen-3 oxidase
LNFDAPTAVESLYIHWPFCPYRCHFCPFIALAGQDQFMEQYHQTLIQEIVAYASRLTKPDTIQTIFFGGGTPSTYPLPLLLDMFDTLNKVFNFHVLPEITIEVNPGTVTNEHFDVWRQLGINRLSVGVQSLQENTLKSLNRHQSTRDVFHLLETAGPIFKNISVDFIIGLPGITQDMWKDYMSQAVQWPISHMSIYFLTVHENTQLYFGVKKRTVTLPADEETLTLYYWTVDFLKLHGFRQYEVSNFTREGHECLHNQAYWNRKPYKGFGLGAYSFDGKRRFQNEKNLMAYFNAVTQNDKVTIFCEELTPEQEWLEAVMLGLRQAKGVELAYIAQHFTTLQQERLYKIVDLLCETSLLNRKNNVIFLTPAGLAVENEIILKLSAL